MSVSLMVAAAAVLGVAVGLVVRRRLVFVTEVDSSSMAPTLVSGQRLLTRRRRRGSRPARGDIVVVTSRELGRTVVKRVVGLPGERVDVDRHGRARVDGVPLEEGYVTRPGGRAGTFAVPDGHVFLLGDNRAASSDGRTWQQPFLPVAAVRGTVLRRPGAELWSGRATDRRRGSRRSGRGPAGSGRPTAWR